MNLRNRLAKLEAAAAIVPDPADPRLLIPAAVREILADPARLESELAFDEAHFADGLDVGEVDEATRAKDAAAFRLLLETPITPFSERN
jgi:hypothetical protein